MKIAIDVMGTDYGPGEIIKGALQAVDEYGCQVVLVGKEETIKEELAKQNHADNKLVVIQNATEVIEMSDHPGVSVKKKKDASIVGSN